MSPLLLAALLTLTVDARPPGHLRPFGEQGTRVKVEVHDGFVPPRKFIKDFMEGEKPVLMKGAAKTSPAWKLWTDEYLAKNSPDGLQGHVLVEIGKKENRSLSYYYQHFRHFLAEYNKTEVYMVNEVPKFMLKDLVLPYSLQCRELVKGGLDSHVMWMSSGGTSSVLHHDPFHNINCLFRGSKKMVFLNTTKYRDIEPMIADMDHAYSSIDVDRVDLDKKPHLSGLEYFHTDMEAGDCVYIPFSWLHQVRSYGSNLAVNIWWDFNEINVKNCLKEMKKELTFETVKFQEGIRETTKDIDGLRTAMAENSVDSFEAFISLLGVNKLSGDIGKKMSGIAQELFSQLDSNADGKMTKEDGDKKSMSLRRLLTLDSLLASYNDNIHELREANAEHLASMPLYIFRSSPDVFTADNCVGFNIAAGIIEKKKKHHTYHPIRTEL